MSVRVTSSAADWQQTMVDLVDDIYSSDASAPPGTWGRICATLDDLRAQRAEHRHIVLAEQVALTVHRLDFMLRHEGRASAEAAALRRDLRRTMFDWLQDQPVAAFA